MGTAAPLPEQSDELAGPPGNSTRHYKCFRGFAMLGAWDSLRGVEVGCREVGDPAFSGGNLLTRHLR